MSLLSTRRAGTRPRFLLAAGARARGRALLAGRRWLRAQSIPIEPMKFYSLPTLAQGEADTTFGDAGPKSGFLHIWRTSRRGTGVQPAGAAGAGAGAGLADTHSGPGGYTFVARMCIGEPRDKPLATVRTWQRHVGCARPTAPRSPRESPPWPLRAGSPTAGPPRMPQRWPAR